MECACNSFRTIIWVTKSNSCEQRVLLLLKSLHFSRKPFCPSEQFHYHLRGETEAKIYHETRRFLPNITAYSCIICLLCIKISVLCCVLVGNAEPQHCIFPDILVEQIPKGPSQVDVTWLWAISIQSHVNVFLNLQLDSLINNSTERGVNFHYLSQWAVNFDT